MDVIKINVILKILLYISIFGFIDNFYAQPIIDTRLGEHLVSVSSPSISRGAGPVPIMTESVRKVLVTLKDGTKIEGEIVFLDSNNIIITTVLGLEIKIPQNLIISLKPISTLFGGEKFFYRLDPNYSRLMFAPTGRPLRRGEGYLADYYIFFPSIAYGLTNNLSLMAGISIFPGVSFEYQLKYFAPRFAIYLTDKLAVSSGFLYVSVAEEFTAGLAFAVSTFGKEDKSLTLGLAYGYTKEKNTDLIFARYPILVVGGNVRISNNIAFVSENWFFTTGNEFILSHQPFALAIRFFGERIAVDVGFVIIPELLNYGVPIPWLSFVYNFGMNPVLKK